MIAVVGKAPGLTPEVANEGVAIGRGDLALGGLADMGDDIARAPGVALHPGRNRRAGRGLLIDDELAALFLVERDSPAIGVFVGLPATEKEAGERETELRGLERIHS
jgi:hypothetical protein